MMSSLNTGKNIFISRLLTSQSPFHSLAQHDYKIYHESLIDIEPVSFQVVQNYEAVFFYSRTAIQYFFEKKPYKTDVAYGVMGQPSAKAFSENCGYKPDIIGDGNLDLLCQEILRAWAGKTILFPQAKVSLKSVESRLPNQDCVPIIIYNNSIKTEINTPDCDIVLLTSPLNAEAYLAHFDIDNKLVLSIGSTTADYISRKTGLSTAYCKEPSMTSLYSLLLEHLNLRAKS